VVLVPTLRDALLRRAPQGEVLLEGPMCSRLSRKDPGGNRDRSIDQLPIRVEERVRAIIVADDGGVGDELAVVPPVQHETRRLHAEAAGGVGMDVERDLVRRAGAGQGRPATDLGMDRAMEMTAQDQFDLRMPGDDLGEGLAAQKADLVHVADAGDEGWVMHHHQRGHVGFVGQRAVEPVEPLAAEFAAALARDQRVEANEAQRIVVDRELEELPLGRQVAAAAKGIAHRLKRMNA